MQKRLWSAVLAACMLLTLLPAPVPALAVATASAGTGAGKSVKSIHAASTADQSRFCIILILHAFTAGYPAECPAVFYYAMRINFIVFRRKSQDLPAPSQP